MLQSRRFKGQVKKRPVYIGMKKRSASNMKKTASSFAGAFDPATNVKIKKS